MSLTASQNKIDPGAFNRLPKWAQQYVRLLEHHVEQQTDLLELKPKTLVYMKEHGCPTLYLPDDRPITMEFRMRHPGPKEEVTFSYELGSKGELDKSAIVVRTLGSALQVNPNASNSITIKPRED